MVGTRVFNMGSGDFMGADNQIIIFFAAAEYLSPSPQTLIAFFLFSLFLGIDRGLLETL